MQLVRQQRRISRDDDDNGSEPLIERTIERARARRATRRHRFEPRLCERLRAGIAGAQPLHRLANRNATDSEIISVAGIALHENADLVPAEFGLEHARGRTDAALESETHHARAATDS